MSILAKYNAAMEAKDEAAMNEIYMMIISLQCMHQVMF
jgi:hypothetical protein